MSRRPARKITPVETEIDAPSQAERRAPIETDPDEETQAATHAFAASAPEDPFGLKDPDLYMSFKTAHDKLFKDLGGMDIVSAQSVGARSGAPAGRENIVGSFIGRKYSNGKPVPGLALVVQVKRKFTNARDIDSNVQIPPEVTVGRLKIPTDVKSVGDVVAFGYQSFEQPTICGSTIGHGPTGETGTLGVMCVLDDGKLCILSNTHVMSPGNSGQEGIDKIKHPGAADSSSHAVNVGILHRFVALNLSAASSGGAVNYVDAAVAKTNRARVSAAHHEFTINPDPKFNWSINLQLKKEGRTTGYSEGRIIGGNGRVIPAYRTTGGGVAYGYFENQLVIEGFHGPFSKPGDSGSLIVDLESDQPVGLLFAGTNDLTLTYANPIALVMEALGIEYFVDQ